MNHFENILTIVPYFNEMSGIKAGWRFMASGKPFHYCFFCIPHYGDPGKFK
jgi:hypothetical protein